MAVRPIYLSSVCTPKARFEKYGLIISQEKCLTPYASAVIDNFAEVGLALNISSDLASKSSDP